MRRHLSFAWKVAVGVIVGFAVLLTLLRIFTPLVADFREEIATEIGRNLGHPVEIGELDAEWRILMPRLYLRQVVVGGVDGLSFDAVEVDIDILGSFFGQSLRIALLKLSGADMHLIRHEEGSIEMVGISLQGRQVTEPPSIELRFIDTHLRWEDRLHGYNWRLEHVELNIRLDSGGMHLAAEFVPPRSLGGRMTVGADLRGNPREPAAFAGSVYFKGESLDLDGLAGELRLSGITVDDGRGDIQFWGELKAGHLVHAQGNIVVQELQVSTVDDVSSAAEPQQVTFDRVSGRVQWASQASGWRLDVSDWQVTREGESWSAKGIALAMKLEEDGRELRLAADRLRIQDVAAVARLFPVTGTGQGTLVLNRKPSGDLLGIDLTLRLPDTGEPAFRVSGEVRDFAIEALDKLPGLQGVAAQFSADERGGEGLVDANGLRLDFPTLFADSLWFDTVSGQVDWTRTETGYDVDVSDLRVANADIRSWGNFRLTVADSDSSLDLKMHYADGNGLYTARYLPGRVLPKRTYEWLEHSILDGKVIEGSVVFRGRFRDFPFDDGSGLFETRSRIEHGTLDYQDGWPRLENASLDLVFRNKSMLAENISADVSGVKITDATVRIDDLKHAVLDVQGRIEGPLPGMMHFLDASPLGRGHEALVHDPVFGGNASLALGIRMPLTHGHIHETTVSGEVELTDNRLEFPGEGIVFEGVRGAVRFTESSIDAKGIAGQFRGSPVTVDASKQAASPTHVELRGRLGPEALGADLPKEWSHRFRGEADWRMTVTLAAEGAISKGAVLNAASDLQGLAVDLPAPLGKMAAEVRPFTAEIPLGDADGRTMRFSLDETMLAILEFSSTPQGLSLQRGEVRIDKGRPVLPAAGMRIIGRLDRIVLDEWTPFAGEGMGGGDPVLREIDLDIGKLDTGGRIFTAVRVQAIRHAAHWQADVRSPAIAGIIEYPHDIHAQPMVVDLDYLLTDQIEGGAAGSQARPIDPRELPALHITSRRFELDGRPLGTLAFETARVADGQRIDHLRLSGEHLFIDGSGAWRMRSDGQETEMRFSMTSEDVGKALSTLGFTHAFAEGKARLDGSLVWPDMPARFDWGETDGEVKLSIKDGRLVDIEPGAGRILGLFSLQALPRRLILDFGDLLQKGFSFDRMEGRAVLDDGNAVTDDLYIDGPSARVEIRGRTGIAARDQDLHVSVTPRVTSTLPLAGAVLGGPATGAVIWLADKLFKGIGKRIDEIAHVDYRITGSWEDPVIVGVPIAKDGG